ncbi:unnamed protein product [Allacma fusca]|uniref:Peptidase S1 domain-containing protein n=1 Tax=Allacma fusca TaxID=39272 RepID=A0A8J2J292_9HEXA|nr:unnamed protein product [Allacma fusca]
MGWKKTKINLILLFLFCANSEQSVLVKTGLRKPALAPEWLSSKEAQADHEGGIPRREDDFLVLAEDDPTTVVPAQESEFDPDVKTEEPETFAVFGSGFRPVFPEDNIDIIAFKNNLTIADPSPPVHSSEIGFVDVSLAQIANINVHSSNASKINVFASRDGLNCSCGRPNIGQRIVNGVPVKINELPWTVALFKQNWFGFYGSKPYCGGTLINSRYILTASHCVDGQSAKYLKVRLHEEDLSTTTENTQSYLEIPVEEIIMHPEYNRRTIDNDVALLKLKKEVTLSQDSVFQPVCIPASDGPTFESYNATVAGWGATSAGGSQSTVLRKVDVPIMSNIDCNTKTNYGGKITDNMLCAGYLETGGKDSCQGDSGGPLIVDNDGHNTLVGVVSWGYGCARPKSPGVYARVARFGDWILSNTKGAQWCQS